MNRNYFTELAGYTRWVDQRAMDWLAAIDDDQWNKVNPSSFSSVRQTAIHIASAEKIWIDFWTGVTNPIYLSGMFAGSKDELIGIWQKASEGLFNFISNHPEHELELPVTYIYPNGRVGQMPYYQSFAHIVNHSTYHRGQLVTLLRQAGFSDFTSTDLATYHQLKSREEPLSVAY